MSENILGEGPWYISNTNGIYLSGKFGDAVGSPSPDVQWKLHEDNHILTLSRHVKGELELHRLALGDELPASGCFKISIKSDDSPKTYPKNRLWTLEDIKLESVPPGSFAFAARIQSVENPDLSIALDNDYIKDPNVIAMSKDLITGKPPGFRIWRFKRAGNAVPESEN